MGAETHRWLALHQNLEQLDRLGAEEARAEVRLIRNRIKLRLPKSDQPVDAS